MNGGGLISRNNGDRLFFPQDIISPPCYHEWQRNIRMKKNAPMLRSMPQSINTPGIAFCNK